MIPPDQMLTLTLSAADVNAIMGGLSEMPFRVAAPVIGRIETQVRAQAPGAYEPPMAPNDPRRAGELLTNGTGEDHGEDSASRV